jgi:hypothetical protein
MAAIRKNDVARMSGDLAGRLETADWGCCSASLVDLGERPPLAPGGYRRALHAAPLGMYVPMTHL